ncbi:MAG: ABC transporter substrate-binding protein, partial [Mycobacteriales bacterium]
VVAGTTGGSTGAVAGGSAGGTTGGTTGGSTGSVNAKCSTLGQNVPGITPTEIRIGIHAPQTGTGAPLPPSFAQGVQVYWKDPAHKVCGRTVVVDFQDDKYTPQTARDVCGPMSRRDFLVVGAAGTDQIQSCATMPDIAGKGVPYLSAGVTTNGLIGLKHYFATTLTYAAQADLVLRNAKQQGLGLKKWAVITSNTNNFKDARDAMESVLKQAGVPFDDIQVDATNDNGLQGRAAQTGTQIATGGYDTVFLDTSPGYFIYMSGTASKQGFSGTYTGPGVTMTEVTVAQLVCSASAGLVKANFLAPYPGIDRATPAFVKATGGQYDDIYWSLWGLSQALEQALDNASSLTREGFISSLQNASLPGGVYPPIKFNGGHFGGTGAWSQRMNCSKTEPNQSQAGSWDTVSGPLYK